MSASCLSVIFYSSLPTSLLLLPDPNLSLHFPPYGSLSKHPTVVLYISTFLLKHPLPSFGQSPKKFIHSHESHGNVASSCLSVTKLCLSSAIGGMGALYYAYCYLLTHYGYLLITFTISCFCLLVSKLLTQYSHSNQISLQPRDSHTL